MHASVACLAMSQLPAEGHRRACMQPVSAIVHIAGAQKLAVLCDGALLLLDYESLEESALPAIKVCRAPLSKPC